MYLEKLPRIPHVRYIHLKIVSARQWGKTADSFRISKLEMQISQRVLILSKKQAQIRILQQKKH